MKIQLTVDVDDQDADFFGKLNTGEYSWSTGAMLNIVGPGNDVTVDASWVLRSSVAFLETEKQ